MRKHKLLAAFLAGCIAACTPLALDSVRLDPPGTRTVIAVKSERPLIALALGAGGARGFAHVGVIKGLEEAGIVPDIVVGSSSGAIVAALYAGGYSGAQLERLAADVSESSLIDFSLFGKGWVRGEALQAFVNRALGNRPIEQLAKPFAVVVTHGASGEMIVFNRGDPGLAVRASSAVPDLFIPPVIDGIEYLDGGLSTPVPVRLARTMGADFSSAVDLTRYPRSRERAQADLLDADFVIRPETIRTRMLDFTAKFQNMKAGEAAAREAADAIIGQLRQKPKNVTTAPAVELPSPARPQGAASLPDGG
jgi:NTE family protein